jgi:hypothetical protein
MTALFEGSGENNTVPRTEQNLQIGIHYEKILPYESTLGDETCPLGLNQERKNSGCYFIDKNHVSQERMSQSARSVRERKVRGISMPLPLMGKKES